MLNRNLWTCRSGIAAALGMAAWLVACGVPARGADHLDAPALSNPAVTGPQDVNDVYAFQGTRPNTTVFVMTVNPGAGVLSPTMFAPNTIYEFRIDTDSDAVANLIYQFQFIANPRRPDDQRVFARRVDTGTAAGSRGIGLLQGVGRVGQTFRMGRTGRATVQLFDDPFFFDLNGFQNGLNFTGDDFFAGLNVTAIVMELPNADVTRGNPNISVWCRTLASGSAQVDRMGRPAINTVLIPTSMKDTFNQGQPVVDPTVFGPTVVSTLTSPPFNRSSEDAMGLAAFLLPDVLTFEVNNSAGFPNGRRLADDVIDTELGLLTAGALTTDGVDANDQAFPPSFPYLAPPHSSDPE